jgi:hypothetical protein
MAQKEVKERRKWEFLADFDLKKSAEDLAANRGVSFHKRFDNSQGIRYLLVCRHQVLEIILPI